MKITIQQKLVLSEPEIEAFKLAQGEDAYKGPVIIPFFSLQNATADQVAKAKKIIETFNDLGDDATWLAQDGATLEMVIEE